MTIKGYLFSWISIPSMDMADPWVPCNIYIHDSVTMKYIGAKNEKMVEFLITLWMFCPGATLFFFFSPTLSCFEIVVIHLDLTCNRGSSERCLKKGDPSLLLMWSLPQEPAGSRGRRYSKAST